MGFNKFEINKKENYEDNLERYIRFYKEELYILNSYGFKTEKFNADAVERSFDKQYGMMFYNSLDYVS